MHSSGDVGAQLRHSESSVFSMVARSRLSPLCLGCLGWRTFNFLFSYGAMCVKAGKECGGLDGIEPSVRMYDARLDTRHKLCHAAYLNNLCPQNSRRRGNIDTTMRDRSKDSAASSQSNHGTLYS